MNHTRRLAVAGAALISGLAFPAAAWAQGYVGPPPEVSDQQLSRSARSDRAPVSQDSTLPVTGGDLVGLTVIGLGAVGAGTFFVRRSRTRLTA
ncbi:MAG: LPXTG cell wall anchor domain-containing protein [Actinomycetota bacterium]|nr:LPXTG cell wall anchor domain-containing protein [Actinomycetota bacterium]MDQ3681349.1 LPXTG cell wall anchor domain-containing protein [Actinomycetota bacterium]